MPRGQVYLTNSCGICPWGGTCREPQPVIPADTLPPPAFSVGLIVNSPGAEWHLTCLFSQSAVCPACSASWGTGASIPTRPHFFEVHDSALLDAPGTQLIGPRWIPAQCTQPDFFPWEFGVGRGETQLASEPGAGIQFNTKLGQ